MRASLFAALQDSRLQSLFWKNAKTYLPLSRMVLSTACFVFGIVGCRPASYYVHPSLRQKEVWGFPDTPEKSVEVNGARYRVSGGYGMDYSYQRHSLFEILPELEVQNAVMLSHTGDKYEGIIRHFEQFTVITFDLGLPQKKTIQDYTLVLTGEDFSIQLSCIREVSAWQD